VHLARKSVESGVDAVDLALTVISTLAASQGMSVVELASKLDATAEHLAEILERLVERRFVFRDPTDLFWLGPQLHYVGGHISERTALVHAGTETLEWIVSETHDSASVVMREQLEAVLAMSRGSPEILGLHPMAASRGPLHLGAGGKLLLAYAPQEIIDQVIDTHLSAFTPTHIRTRDDALELLAAIRREGVYVSLGDSHPNVITVAAPVHNAHGRVVAGVLVMCLRSKFTEPHRELMTEVARRAGERISSRLG
jgi:IclR family KDG regulon transcriptional repressor